jgi:hypothetical protein
MNGCEDECVNWRGNNGKPPRIDIETYEGEACPNIGRNVPEGRVWDLGGYQCLPPYNKLSVMPTGRRRAYPASKHNINFVTLDRTAGCGPACPVVWEGGRLPAPPIPIDPSLALSLEEGWGGGRF